MTSHSLPSHVTQNWRVTKPGASGRRGMVASQSRDDAIAPATAHYDDGGFLELIRRRVARRSVSQLADNGPELTAYLTEEIAPSLEPLGFVSTVHDNPRPGFGPFLVAERHEGDDLPTVLVYGYGDTVLGQDARWREGLGPWTVTVEGDRWYGRGTADNKGQHIVNMVALERVLAARGGRLGFNVKFLIEMGEETGSPGLSDLCAVHAGTLRADLLIASDGPRLSAGRPTLFLGSRGARPSAGLRPQSAPDQ